MHCDKQPGHWQLTYTALEVACGRLWRTSTGTARPVLPLTLLRQPPLLQSPGKQGEAECAAPPAQRMDLPQESRAFEHAQSCAGVLAGARSAAPRAPVVTVRSTLIAKWLSMDDQYLGPQTAPNLS